MIFSTEPSRPNWPMSHHGAISGSHTWISIETSVEVQGSWICIITCTACAPWVHTSSVSSQFIFGCESLITQVTIHATGVVRGKGSITVSTLGNFLFLPICPLFRGNLQRRGRAWWPHDFFLVSPSNVYFQSSFCSENIVTLVTENRFLLKGGFLFCFSLFPHVLLLPFHISLYGGGTLLLSLLHQLYRLVLPSFQGEVEGGSQGEAEGELLPFALQCLAEFQALGEHGSIVRSSCHLLRPELLVGSHNWRYWSSAILSELVNWLEVAFSTSLHLDSPTCTSVRPSVSVRLSGVSVYP